MPDAYAAWILQDATAEVVAEPAINGSLRVRLDRPAAAVHLDHLPAGRIALVVGREADPAGLSAALGRLGDRVVDLLLADAAGASAALTALGWANELPAAADAVAPEPVGDTGLLRVPLSPTMSTTATLLAISGGHCGRVGFGAPGWRVHFASPDSVSWLGPGVIAVDGADDVDLIAVGPTDPRPPAESDDGPPLIGVTAAGVASAWVGHAAVEVHGDAGASGQRRPAFPRPVDTSSINPIGFRRSTGARWAAIPSPTPPDGHHDAMAACTAAVGAGNLDLIGDEALAAVPDPAEGSLADVVGALRNHRGVIEHTGLGVDPWQRASLLAALAAAGVPIVALSLDDRVAGLLGAPLAALLSGASVDELADEDARERHSVLCRRAALMAHRSTLRWREVGEAAGLQVPRPPRVSVVLSTNRPTFLDHAIAQVARQSRPDVELIVALHGDAHESDAAARIRAGWDGPLEVLPVSGERSLGDALNAAIERAGGEVITKWDDDDFYGPEHLDDLVLALEYSGADLVGKAAEFVHLADQGLTIRRFTGGAESSSRTLAGGTLTFHRHVWSAVGGFRRLGLGEDVGLIEDVIGGGGTVHRTHGYGYVLHRHGTHAWTRDSREFLDESQTSRPGLDPEWTLT